MFPGPVGTGEGQWELRLNPEGGTALHGREGHGALLARRWEGLEAGRTAVSQGGARSGNAGGPCHSLQPRHLGNAGRQRQHVSQHLAWRLGPTGLFPLPLASVLSGPCFPPLGQRDQRKNKIWDLRENPVVGWTHLVLPTLLHSLEPVSPRPSVCATLPQGKDGEPGWNKDHPCCWMLQRWPLPIPSNEGCVWLPLTDRRGALRQCECL